MELSDEDIMRAYRLGNANAFATLYQRHAAKVYSYLRKRLMNHDEIDDVFQKIFLKLHHKRHQFDLSYNFCQWLFVISKTVLLDHWRQNQTHRPANTEPLSAHNSEKVAPAIEPEFQTLHYLQEATYSGVLSSEQRTLLEWKVLDELSYEDMAKRLNKSQASIRQTISRAVRKLKNIANGKGGLS